MILKNYLGLPRAVYILCLGSFVNRAGTLLIPFLAIYLQGQLNLGVEFATRAMGAYGVGALVAALLGGQLADRIGRRTVMVMSLFGAAAVLLVFETLRSPWAIMAASAVFALVGEMYRPAASAAIADVVEPERRTYAYGLMYVSINLGFSVAPVIGGILATRAFRWLFWGDAITSSLYAVIILVSLAETMPKRGSQAEKPDGQPTPPGGGSGIESADSFIDALKHIAANWPFVIFCIGWLATGCVYMQAMSTFPLYLAQLGIGPETYGRIIALNGIMIVCLQLPVTAAVTRFNRGGVMVFGALLTAIGFGLIGPAETVLHFVLSTVVWTFGEMMQAPLAPTIVTDLAPARFRARYLGVFSACFSGALMFGVPFGGLVLVRAGAAYLWGGCFALALVAAVLYLSVRRSISVKGAIQ